MSELDSPEEATTSSETDERAESEVKPTREVGGPRGKEPTRYGDWEKNGRCIDF